MNKKLISVCLIILFIFGVGIVNSMEYTTEIIVDEVIKNNDSVLIKSHLHGIGLDLSVEEDIKSANLTLDYTINRVNKNITSQTGTNGEDAIFNLTEYGNYTNVKLIYKGLLRDDGIDYKYYPFSLDLEEFALDKASTNLNLTFNSPVVFGDSVNFSANLTDGSGGALSGRSVSFVVNGSVVGNSTTDSDGLAVFTYTPLSAGSYNVTAIFSGDDNYTGSNSGSEVLVVDSDDKSNTSEDNTNDNEVVAVDGVNSGGVGCLPITGVPLFIGFILFVFLVGCFIKI
ncbi:MAG: Ig-like domain-containing protein [Methanobrevibacter sp.]|jgi:hypothetical protein|nr:Ig-like domain-containing protein [Candidatus Methanovirga aequatorialis]